MHYQVLNKIPNNIGLAFSGGIDSVAIFHYLRKTGKSITLFFHDHGNDLATPEATFVKQFASKYDVDLVIGHNSREKLKEESSEEFWRKMRYEFFKLQDIEIIAGHHLDDAVETWLWGCFNGQPQIMPYEHANVIRPFLLTRKSKFLEDVERNQYEYFQDVSNTDLKFTRNRIRHNILPEVLIVNPGIHKVIKKKLIEKWKK